MRLKVIPISTWSPTKLFSYEECPLKTQLRYAQHLCPLCFKGAVPFDGPCDACGWTPVKPPALARGIRLDEAIAAHVSGEPPSLEGEEAVADSLNHPAVVRLVQASRKGGVRAKWKVSLGAAWEVLSKGGGYYTKNAWLNCELDVLKIAKKLASVIDWKSGGIDKRTGKIRENEKYADQLQIYQTVVLASEPAVDKVEAQLVFLDAPERDKAGKKVDPVVLVPAVLRGALDKLKKKWEGRLKPMFSDKTFAPRPGWQCAYCDYSERRAGPCKY